MLSSMKLVSAAWADVTARMRMVTSFMAFYLDFSIDVQRPRIPTRLLERKQSKEM